ncbi:kynureninase [Flavisolibacter tropicus]|uniref:Kynureninase n=1 Tax=Flavisolibacter tropicus TaxID=1492898 RepID=A0A172TSR3_9BACT|nr:kynureninase [Flavisolibacter tropicus]ANE50070.1 kynureninase [Flavisolibacter tropicus]
MKFLNTQDFAQQLDAADSLRSFRQQFLFPQHNGKDAIYFLGNSLGLQPKRTATDMAEVMQQWQELGVESWFKGDKPWLQYHDKLVGPLAAIVGALPGEIVVMNSLTVNLHLMLASFYQPKGKRNKIICEAKAFPSDQYTLETHVKQRGFKPEDVIVEVAPREGEVNIRHEDVLAAIEANKDELALIFWGGLNYYTGQVFNMKTITAAAHAVGAMVGFDLAHAAGNIQLQLHNWDVDFACWCSYKYLNSGPGAIGGVYIHERFHNDKELPRFAGWWGYNKATRFKMQPGFDPIPSAEGWQLSTPSVLLYAAHYSSLQLFEKAGMSSLYQKGQQLSDYLLFLLQDLNANSSQPIVQVLTPKENKGCQVSMLMLRNGREVFDALTDAGVFADWREPNVIRIAAVPMYNTFEEVWQFAQIMKTTCEQFQ